MKTFTLLLTALALARPACADPVDPSLIRPAPQVRPGPALLQLDAASAAGGKLGHVMDGSLRTGVSLAVRDSGGKQPAPSKGQGVTIVSPAPPPPAAEEPAGFDQALGYVGADACTGLVTCMKDAFLSLPMVPFHTAKGIGTMGVEGSETNLGKILLGGFGGALGLLLGVILAPLAVGVNLVKGTFKAFQGDFL